MQISVHTISDGGIDIPVQLEQSWAAAVATTVLETPALGLSGLLHFRLRGRSVQVSGSVSSRGMRTCQRCNAEVEAVVNTDVDLAYVPSSHMASGGADIQLSAGDLDVGWYYDGVIVVDDVLSEALTLALPDRIICTNVPACDARISNLLASAGDSQARESTFAALKTLL
ncbi:MAG: uncharacterized metal-binding protein YceD (DUF177 family) [Kiritimatiellia bacterium]